ncbi:MAG: CerR family C-terminal domain-containing protein [Acidobacteriota bacterium]
MTTAIDTKERLLAAGMEVFAERGFADAGVREICALAGANPAAVNYHFGDKKRFYAEVLATSHLRAVHRQPMPRLSEAPDEPGTVLAAWAHWFLSMLLHEGTGPLGKLMSREMADPTEALDEVIRRSFAPLYQELSGIVGALAPGLPPRRLHLHVRSVLGQCLFYKHGQHAIRRLRNHLPGSADGAEVPVLEELAQHIADVSCAGLAAELRRRAASGDEP